MIVGLLIATLFIPISLLIAWGMSVFYRRDGAAGQSYEAPVDATDSDAGVQA